MKDFQDEEIHVGDILSYARSYGSSAEHTIVKCLDVDSDWIKMQYLGGETKTNYMIGKVSKVYTPSRLAILAPTR